MNPIEQFENEVRGNVERLGADRELAAQSMAWMLKAGAVGAYTYNFKWLGRPIIQYPQDMVAMQELIWQVRPDLIVETGIAHGGSLIFSASMLAMLDVADAIESGVPFDPRASRRQALGIDIDIRAHNRQAIETHPMSRYIRMIEGSSIAPEVVAQVAEAARGRRVLVCLDSNHTHDHVLAELRAYAPLVAVGSYCAVFDTVIEDMPPTMFADRPWRPGNSPLTAVREFLAGAPGFEVDHEIENKLMITVARGGFLRRVATSARTGAAST